METDSEKATILVLLGATKFQQQCVNNFCIAKGLWFNWKTKPNLFFPAKDNYFKTPKGYLEFLYRVAGMLKFNTNCHLKELPPFRSILIL